ncbi:unnamed protein product [Caenorhabditis brenneri]
MLAGLAFEMFKEQCKDLRDQHRRVCIEYDIIEPKLLRVDERMKKGRELKDNCDMDRLLFALQVLDLKASGFNAEGSSDKDKFLSRIGEVIEITRQLRSDINKIKSKIADYEAYDRESVGIADELRKIVDNMKDMGELMQMFNVVGNDCSLEDKVPSDQDQLSERLADELTKLGKTATTEKMTLGFAFQLFKDQCKDLRDQHRRFYIEYDIIEPKLLQIHNHMMKGKRLQDNFSMNGLLFALQVLSLKATVFSVEGSNDEKKFQWKIGEVIEITRQFRSDFNKIKAKIADYMEEEEEGTGIGEELGNIADKMKEMGELMQLFNVIGVDRFLEIHEPPSEKPSITKPTITED